MPQAFESPSLNQIYVWNFTLDTMKEETMAHLKEQLREITDLFGVIEQLKETRGNYAFHITINELLRKKILQPDLWSNNFISVIILFRDYALQHK
jgi:Asp-tRNA(Asn)/Glu-tRNA(Gln) amidotransferase C subunit